MLSEEEVKDIKKKLIAHIESTFPPDQVSSAKSQINSMNSEQLESFLKKNNIMTTDQEENNNCIFCSIISGKVNSCKILENEGAIAVLDINSISKGHTIIIQKEHSEELQDETRILAEEVANRIRKNFSPKRVELSEGKLFGHSTISLLPIYKDENFSSEKTHLSMEDLERIREELDTEEQEEEIPIPAQEEKEEEKFSWLPKRFP